MHTPETQPRSSVFYNYKVHPFRTPPERSGSVANSPVIIVGAGPVGMVAALDLARWGVPSIILESELQVSHGSRAIVLTRRSMEILQQVGVADEFMKKGLTWNRGRSFFKGRQVYEMVMPHDPDDRYLPGLNIQQQFIEQILVEAIEANPLIDLRWGSAVTDVVQDEASATLSVDTPEGEYQLTAPWVVAADGGRSVLRRILGLRMEGRSYAGNFVIADVVADIGLPTERLCYFDPDWNPGNNVLVHRQPDSLWRIDFRLPDGETAEQALEESCLSERINLVLKMIGRPVPWKMDWATVYSANTLTLPDYRAGRVLLVGDAAHLLPIFGVRGANTGFQDATNLSWKLALVAKGDAPATLLDSYSDERVAAAREICAEGGRSTRFMTPPTAGYRLMRDAVLSLVLSETFCKDLLHWRTSRPHDYINSSLNSFTDEDRGFDGGRGCGQPVSDVCLGPDRYLLDDLPAGFQLILFAQGSSDTWLADMLRAAADAPVNVNSIVIVETVDNGVALNGKVIAGAEAVRVREKFAAANGTAYLVRPDMHVAARSKHADPRFVQQAIEAALGRGK